MKLGWPHIEAKHWPPCVERVCNGWGQYLLCTLQAPIHISTRAGFLTALKMKIWGHPKSLLLIGSSKAPQGTRLNICSKPFRRKSVYKVKIWKFEFSRHETRKNRQPNKAKLILLSKEFNICVPNKLKLVLFSQKCNICVPNKPKLALFSKNCNLCVQVWAK